MDVLLMPKFEIALVLYRTMLLLYYFYNIPFDCEWIDALVLAKGYERTRTAFWPEVNKFECSTTPDFTVPYHIGRLFHVIIILLKYII